jgi:Carbohydrate-binding module family 5/12
MTVAAGDEAIIADVIARVVKFATAGVTRELAAAVERVEALERQIAEVHQRQAEWRDAGVWKAGTEYAPGNVVTHGGSGWICRAHHLAVGTEPSHEAFRLLVKAGRDRR